VQIRYYHLAKVSSTNTWAKEHAHEFALDELAAISATEQTQGRGRYARMWYSPPGKNLYLTLGFYLEDPTTKPFALCQLASLTVEELLKNHGIVAKIKWPNDLLVNGKKIVGILTERTEVNGHQFMSIGIGLNVNMTPDELTNIPQAATSMLIERGEPFVIEAVKEYYVRLFAQRLNVAKATGFDEVLRHWQKSLEWMLHHPVSVQTQGSRLQGKVVALHADGGLIVELPNGTTQVVQTQDVNLS
jgi:BirA family biotin operon repressor/biotin-[acetyl-CoA-carboxylase] ligase